MDSAFLPRTSYDLQRARQKREMAARLRQVAPGLSVPSERAWLYSDADALEREAAQLEGKPLPQSGQPVVQKQEQAQQQEQSGKPEKPKP